jgi:hypothetical protein
MQGILFQADQIFRLVFIMVFVIECIVVVAFGMESVKEQRIYVKFCFKVEKTAAEHPSRCLKLTAMMPGVKR